MVQTSFPKRYPITQTAFLTTLLLLPVLIQLWLQREQLLHELAIALNSRQSPQKSHSSTPPNRQRVTAIAASSDTVQPDGQTELVANPAHSAQRPDPPHSTPTHLAPTHLAISSLPGVDIHLENDLPFEVRLDPTGKTVAIYLEVSAAPLPATPPLNELALATIRRSDSGQVVARILQTVDGITIAAGVSHDRPTESHSATPDMGQVVATIRATSEGELAAVLSATTPNSQIPQRQGGDRPSYFQPPSQDPLPQVPSQVRSQVRSQVIIRQVDLLDLRQLVSLPRSNVEIRFQVDDSGSYDLIISPVSTPSSPSPLRLQEPEFHDQVMAEHVEDSHSKRESRSELGSPWAEIAPAEGSPNSWATKTIQINLPVEPAVADLSPNFGTDISTDNSLTTNSLTTNSLTTNSLTTNSLATKQSLVRINAPLAQIALSGVEDGWQVAEFDRPDGLVRYSDRPASPPAWVNLPWMVSIVADTPLPAPIPQPGAIGSLSSEFLQASLPHQPGVEPSSFPIATPWFPPIS